MNRKLLQIFPRRETPIVMQPLIPLGWEVYAATDVDEAKRLIDSHDFHVAVVFINRDFAGISQLEEILLASTTTEWVAVVPPVNQLSADVVKIMGDFFFDYHTLPLDIERLSVILGHAYGKGEIKRRLADRFKAMCGNGEFQMIGQSASMKQLYRDLRKVHGSDAPVLIQGESGTGKELAAQAIHKYSCRANQPFIAVNCGSIPAHLVQSELFGHEKGSFTGAYSRAVGRIEAAHGGTIFLDEIGDLSLDLQVNLLRFIEEKTIQRVGSSKPIEVDARVIAATHIDLEEAVAMGKFREDLFYRINVLQLIIPPLRSRQSDIELLAHEYFKKFSRDRGSIAKGISSQALQAMRNHDWPGNVRELINRVRRAVVMSERRLLTPADLGLEKRRTSRQPLKLEVARNQTERETINQALFRTNHNVSEAARQLGVSRVTLYRLMGRLGAD